MTTVGQKDIRLALERMVGGSGVDSVSKGPK